MENLKTFNNYLEIDHVCQWHFNLIQNASLGYTYLFFKVFTFLSRDRHQLHHHVLLNLDRWVPTAISSLWEARSRSLSNRICMKKTWVMRLFCFKSLHETFFIYLFGQCECDGHPVYNLIQWHLVSSWGSVYVYACVVRSLPIDQLYQSSASISP